MRSVAASASNSTMTGGVLILCLLAAPTPVAGFAPHHRHLSTKTALEPIVKQGQGFHPSAHVGSLNSLSSAARAAPSIAPATTTALQANLIDRFVRVARGNLNSALSRLEDPEKVMDQALVDMQNDITKVRQTYAEVTAGQRRLATKKNQQESIADDWYRRAQLAVKRGKEGLAKEALARREQALQQARAVEEQMDAQAITLDKLYEGMQALEGKILEANSRKSQLAARAKTAKSTTQVNEMLSGLTGKTSMDAFRRMEDKVVALETAAEVSAEFLEDALLFAPSSSVTEGNTKRDMELEFRRLEASDSVEQELALLKASLLPPATTTTKVTQTVERVKKEPVQIPINPL